MNVDYLSIIMFPKIFAPQFQLRVFYSFGFKLAFKRIFTGLHENLGPGLVLISFPKYLGSLQSKPM